MNNLKNAQIYSRRRYADAKAPKIPSQLQDLPELWSSAVPLLSEMAQRARLTPDRLQRIITSADGGQPFEQAALFDVMLEKEPRFAAHLQTRRLAVLRCKWRVENPDDKKSAEEIENMFRAAGLRDAMSQLLRAIGIGYAGVMVNWERGGASIKGFESIASDRFVFDEVGFPAVLPDAGEPLPLSSFAPAQILYTVADGQCGLPTRAGLLRTLMWLYLFKNTNFTLWNQFLERFGVPFILGKLPSGDFNDAKKRAELLRSIMNVRSGGGGVGTTETDMQTINGASGSNQEAFAEFQRYCDETATLVILGQLASSDHAGGLSSGTAQDQVRQDILQSDCELISKQIQKLLDWYIRFTIGEEAVGKFKFVIDCEKPEDMNIRADRDAKIAAAAGCRLSRKYAEETYGVQLEEMPAMYADVFADMYLKKK